MLRASTVLSLAILPACLVAPESAPRVDLAFEAATAFVERGTPNVLTGVVQGEMVTTLPTTDGGRLALGAWGNVNLDDDSGDAWFPDGASGDFTELEFFARYARTFDCTTVSLGITNYTLTQGSEFVTSAAQGVRGATNEVAVVVEQGSLPLEIVPRLEVHYDYDEVEGFHIRLGLMRNWQLSEKFALDLDLSQGWSDDEQAFWAYGIPDGGAGLVDLRLEAHLRYAVAANATASLFLAGSTMIDGTLRDWFDLVSDSGFDMPADIVWGGLGIEWRF